MDQGGLPEEATVPYEADDYYCNQVTDNQKIKAKPLGWIQKYNPTIKEMRDAIWLGPAYVALDADSL